MTKPANPRLVSETILLAWVTAIISLASFLFYYRHGEVLLYGDAVAHINIARRVFDSRTPGLLQLGTVWLPLPHLLMIPFVLSNDMWRNGGGGSIPSLIAYVLGAVGIFRLARESLSVDEQSDNAARFAAWAAALIYASNPNLLYLQTTAMTETLYLALFIWAVLHFKRFVQASVGSGEGASSALFKCGWCIAGACLTRYEGWLLAVVAVAAVLLVAMRAQRREQGALGGVAKFVLLAAVVPILWIAYNAIVYRNPLEFANGPYSAKAIEQKTAAPGSPPHPGTNNIPVAATFFLKAGQLNVAEGNWGRLWLLLAVVGTIAASVPIWRGRIQAEGRVPPLWPMLLLWVPLPFYTLSIAYGGVPIFLPVWWPYSIYNARYGLELLPAFAVFTALAVYCVADVLLTSRGSAMLAAALVLFIAASYAFVWRAQPVCFREAWINSRTRFALEHELASVFAKLPPDSTFLMYLGDHVGSLETAGIPLRRVIYEGNHRTWKQPSDPDGLWERALANPERHADIVVAFDGDAVSCGVNKHGLLPFAVIHVAGQPRTTLYTTHSAVR
jgi:hypothetical protein